MGERGFPNSRHIFDEQVTAGEQRHDRESNCVRLSANHPLNCSLQQLDLLGRSHGKSVGIGCA
jgi:hypothetical protein